jgi:DNA transformation protein and related proteins
MKRDAAFLEHLQELLAPMGGISLRAMFGGWAVYKDGVVFGLVAEGKFYLKMTDLNRARFQAAGLPPFTFETAKGKSTMSYGLAPESALERAPELLDWAQEAYQAALEAKSKRPARKKSARPKRS